MAVQIANGVHLPEFMEHQQQTNWCWAACGASVGNFFYSGSPFSQCGVANACQGKTTCCSNPAGCNQYGYLDKALRAAKSFDSMRGGTATLAEVGTRLSRSQPVGTRVAWNGGGAHFMMITGYLESPQLITIQDPWYGTSGIAWSAYPASYHGGGSWTHTYFTRKEQGTDVGIKFEVPDIEFHEIEYFVELFIKTLDNKKLALETFDVRDGHEVRFIPASSIAKGELVESEYERRIRHLVHSKEAETGPVGELELNEAEEPVAFHQGPGKDGLRRAIEVAEDLKGDYKASVLHVTPLRFVGLLLEGNDTLIVPYPPNATELENFVPVSEKEALSVLQPMAEAVMREEENDEPTGG